jgi:methanogenic corrinoid protein MtbC1
MRTARLVQTIEGEIIPRLMLVHRASGTPPAVGPSLRNRPSPSDIETLARLALARDSDAALAFVESLRDGGIALDVLYLELLAPSARYLGDLWDQDRNDFMEVTVALLQLHRLLHALAGSSPLESEPREPSRRVLLTPVPGEQHTFGLVMVGEFFRRAGWEVWDEPGATREQLVALLRTEWFSIVGLSVSCERSAGLVAGVIHALRRASLNKSVGIMVGGQPFVGNPDRVALVGADATAADGREATLQAQNLLMALSARAGSPSRA